MVGIFFMESVERFILAQASTVDSTPFSSRINIDPRYYNKKARSHHLESE